MSREKEPLPLAHPNALLAEAVWEAAARGDADALAGLLHDEVTWVAYGIRSDEPRVGREAVLDFLAEVGEVADDLRSDLVDILVSGTRAAILLRLRVRRGDRTADTRVLLLCEIEDGRIREIRSLPLEPDLLREMLG